MTQRTAFSNRLVSASCPYTNSAMYFNGPTSASSLASLVCMITASSFSTSILSCSASINPSSSKILASMSSVLSVLCVLSFSILALIESICDWYLVSTAESSLSKDSCSDVICDCMPSNCVWYLVSTSFVVTTSARSNFICSFTASTSAVSFSLIAMISFCTADATATSFDNISSILAL